MIKPEDLLKLLDTSTPLGAHTAYAIRTLLTRVRDQDERSAERRKNLREVTVERAEALVERDKAKKVIGLLGETTKNLMEEIRTLMAERDEARAQRDNLQRNYANAIGPR